MLRRLRVEVRSAIDGPVSSPLENQILYLSERFERMSVFYTINTVYQLPYVRCGFWRGLGLLEVKGCDDTLGFHLDPPIT